MGQILHPSAKTTAATRREIQNSEESIAKLAKRFGVNKKTIEKWKKRDFVHDCPMGPKNPRSLALSPEEEAACVAFRKTTRLPLDDCLYSMQDAIPKLRRSTLHGVFKRHGINRLCVNEEAPRAKKRFKNYEIGYFHVDIAEVRTQEGKIYLFAAIDRTSKYAYAELKEKCGKVEAAEFLRNLVNAVSYEIKTVLTDNGSQFTNRRKDRFALEHIFDRTCYEYGIEHRLTKVNHPWTNGQIERMNRTFKEATVKRYHYGNHAQLKAHFSAFLDAYNFAKRLKVLNGLSPYEYILKSWQESPNLFRRDPTHLSQGPNT